MNLWGLIRTCMHELELRNNIAFGDSAWQSFKQLEEDIYKLFRERDVQNDITGAFGKLVALIESEHVDYNLFLDNDESHCCELGIWGKEAGEKDVTVAGWGKTPAEAIQTAISKWQTGEQYKPRNPFHLEN